MNVIKNKWVISVWVGVVGTIWLGCATTPEELEGRQFDSITCGTGAKMGAALLGIEHMNHYQRDAICSELRRYERRAQAAEREAARLRGQARNSQPSASKPAAQPVRVQVVLLEGGKLGVSVPMVQLSGASSQKAKLSMSARRDADGWTLVVESNRPRALKPVSAKFVPERGPMIELKKAKLLRKASSRSGPLTSFKVRDDDLAAVVGSAGDLTLHITGERHEVSQIVTSRDLGALRLAFISARKLGCGPASLDELPM